MYVYTTINRTGPQNEADANLVRKEYNMALFAPSPFSNVAVQ